MKPILMLLMLSAVVVFADWTCTPIAPGCVCKTVSDFSCADVNTIRQEFLLKFATLLNGATPDTIAANPVDSTIAVGRFKGGIVRLAFHDAAEYNNTLPDTFPDGSPRFRADGCIDAANSGNLGLQRTIDALQPMWLPHCSRISRADFWYLAAKIVVEESTPYTRIGNPFLPIDSNNSPAVPQGVRNVTNFTIPFFTGRVDRAECAHAAGEPEALPNPEGGALELQRSMMNNFGLDAQHVAALLGAHTLGGASQSGYHGTWKTRPDLFNVGYFKVLIGVPWRRVSMPNPTAGGAPLQQWNHTIANPAVTTLMLNTDLAMIYDVAGNLLPSLEASLPQTCPALTPITPPAKNHFVAQDNIPSPAQLPKQGPPMPPIPPSKPQPPVLTQAPNNNNNNNRGGCPFTKALEPTVLNFADYVQQFTLGSPETGDMPGAQIWLDAFSRALVYTGQVGYAAGELTCLPCSVFSCVNCDTVALCGTNNVFTRANSNHNSVSSSSQGSFMTYIPQIFSSSSSQGSLRSDSSSLSSNSIGFNKNQNERSASHSSATTGLPHTCVIVIAVVSCCVGVGVLSVSSIALYRRFFRRSNKTLPEEPAQAPTYADPSSSENVLATNVEMREPAARSVVAIKLA